MATATLEPMATATLEPMTGATLEIAPPPPTVAGLGREYLSGPVKLDNQLLILLEIDKIFGDEELEAVKDSVVAQ
jgi:purine-binding chemotaxis protein CheW